MPKTKKKDEMVLISVHVPKQLLEEIDKLVEKGMFPSRSELVRYAIYQFVQQYRSQRQFFRDKHGYVELRINPYVDVNNYETVNVNVLERLIEANRNGTWLVCDRCGFPLAKVTIARLERVGGCMYKLRGKVCPACSKKFKGLINYRGIEWSLVGKK